MADAAAGVVAALAGSHAARRPSSQTTTEVPPPGTSGPLLEELARIAAASKGTVGVAAIDVATGGVVAFNADERFKMASTFKVPVAVFALRLAQDGRLSLTEPNPVRREDMVEPGILFEHFRHPGVAISLLNAMELSVTTSDNGATDIILRRVGGPAAVQAWLKSRGYTEMNIGSRTVKETFAPGVAPRPVEAGAAGFDRTVTPREMARFLADLHRGELLAAEGTTTILEMMGRTVGDRLALYLPPGTRRAPQDRDSAWWRRGGVGQRRRVRHEAEWRGRRDGSLHQEQPGVSRTLDARQGDRPCRPRDLRRHPAPRGPVSRPRQHDRRVRPDPDAVARAQPDGRSVKHRGARSANVGRARPSARVEAARCGALRLFRWSAGP
jgi:beta-lactamase class A